MSDLQASQTANTSSLVWRALIETDDQNAPIELGLLDNGSGADDVANDGIYSRYFVGFEAPGRYTLR